jgi:hydroxymethylpyrimidine pyrophosphatase-like HAD family hydrolase
MSAGLKIAMGNAMPELKAAADFVVGSVDDDGFAEAMNRFVLNKN